nr:MAG TPA: hypothetical protein [Bacteriophage sp.]
MNIRTYPYLVHVNAYCRIRLGKVERVREHWRSYPNR